jgi:hypothetical protein
VDSPSVTFHFSFHFKAIRYHAPLGSDPNGATRHRVERRVESD